MAGASTPELQDAAGLNSPSEYAATTTSMAAAAPPTVWLLMTTLDTTPVTAMETACVGLAGPTSLTTASLLYVLLVAMPLEAIAPPPISVSATLAGSLHCVTIASPVLAVLLLVVSALFLISASAGTTTSEPTAKSTSCLVRGNLRV